MKKVLILILFFYLLSLIQVSFLSSFISPGKLPNLILVAVILFIFIEKPNENFSPFAAFFGGLFIDIFSTNFLGTAMVFLLILVFVLKKTIHSLRRLTISWITLISFAALIIYNLFSGLTISLKEGQAAFWPGSAFSIALIYNLILLLAGYYIILFLRKYAESHA